MRIGLISKSISFIAAAAIALSLAGCKKEIGPHSSENSIITADNDEIRSDMTSKAFAEKMGIGINLGNTFDAFWENKSNKTSGASTIGSNTPTDYEKCWGSMAITQEMVDGIAAEGFGTVRIPVYWGNMMADDGTFTINETYFDRVEEVINYCFNSGLYAVINIHHYDEYIIKNFPQDEVLEIVKTLWTQIANRYSEYSDHLIFEGFNENVGSVREGENYDENKIYDYVNALNQTFVDTVRATGGNNEKRMLIASGYWTNIDNTTNPKFIMPADSAEDRLMVSVHYIDNAMYWANKIGGEEWLNYAKAQCELLKNAFTDNGVQVFVGECTGIYEEERFAANAVYTDSSECLGIIMDMVKNYGFIPVIWDVGNGFYSRAQCQLGADSDRAVITDYVNGKS